MGNTFDFSMFGDDQVFNAQKLEETLDRMVSKFSDNITQQQLNNEMKRKNNELLKAGIDSIMDEATIKRKIFEDETFISLVTSLFHEKPNKINGSASEVETNKGHGVKNNGQGIF